MEWRTGAVALSGGVGRASSAEIGVPCISPIPSSSAPAAWYCCSSSIIVGSALFAGHGARAQRQLTEMRPDAGCGECDGGRTGVAGGCGCANSYRRGAELGSAPGNALCSAN